MVFLLTLLLSLPENSPVAVMEAWPLTELPKTDTKLGREIEGCMPRSSRVPPSAPSRYVNYHTLGSALCRPRGHHKP
ncbi:hypothetical protein HPP92_008475 [Vanilla planifolia]|uniref:Secreted protein n=1 Tax=Vanilla planifolia TaxID=51239 RepID=A0A835R841_VANPL|nr:hypothetical protein HPP92_008475 [Vanilla planifolia]